MSAIAQEQSLEAETTAKEAQPETIQIFNERKIDKKIDRKIPERKKRQPVENPKNIQKIEE